MTTTMMIHPLLLRAVEVEAELLRVGELEAELLREGELEAEQLRLHQEQALLLEEVVRKENEKLNNCKMKREGKIFTPIIQNIQNIV